MLIATIIIILGFVGLIWGADKFVEGASGLAQNLGVSPLIIGLTVVAFGTSAPEIFSSAVAALENKPELAIGNSFGSNLFNIGVVLGVCSLIKPLRVPATVLQKELPSLLMITLATGLILMDLNLGFFDAILLLIIAVLFTYLLVRYQLNLDTGSIRTTEQLYEHEVNTISFLRAVGYLTIGLIILVISAEALVQAASNIAKLLGVSEGIIGLTIVALGTSLPELAASVASVIKDRDELAVGNIVGSNIFNLLTVLPFPGFFAPGPFAKNLFYRDFSVVTLLTIVLCVFCYLSLKKRGTIGRTSGIIFLSIYLCWFTVMLIDVRG